MPEQQTVARTIVEQLDQWRIEAVFGVAGDAIIPLLDALGAQDRVRFYPARREDAAAFMASAYAKLTGKPGVCIATSGPGAVSLLNGVADASQDRVPLLVITGQVESWYLGTRHKQYFDQQSLFRTFAGYTALLANPRTTVEVVTRALKTAVVEGKVSHISIPKDLFTAAAPVTVRPPEPYLFTRPASDPAVVDGVVPILNEACRPVILAGRGARGFTRELIALAEKWGAGIIHTMPATGIVPCSHPLALGSLGLAGKGSAANALARADLCLVIGATWWPAEHAPRSLPVVQIDLDPANIGTQTPVRYGIVGHLGSILPRLATLLPKATRTGWLSELGRLRNEWRERINAETECTGPPIRPQFLVSTLQQVVDPDAMIVLDVGDHFVWFARVYEARREEVLVSGRWRSMGFALPAAITAQILQPNRQVVVFTGDGGFGMAMPELATAVQYNLPITIVVDNNRTLSMEKGRMVVGNFRPVGVDLHNPNFADYARSVGCLGFRVEQPSDLAGRLREALDANAPALVDVLTAHAIPPGTKY